MADLFDVLADPTRRDLLVALLAASGSGEPEGGALSVGQLVERLGLTQPTVSKHLRVLRDHGLVAVREHGQRRFYRLNPDPLEELEGWLHPFLNGPGPAETALPAVDNTSVYLAWAGGDAGNRVGRALADRTHQARSGWEDARREVTARLRRPKGK